MQAMCAKGVRRGKGQGDDYDVKAGQRAEAEGVLHFISAQYRPLGVLPLLPGLTGTDTTEQGFPSVALTAS